MNRGNFPSKPSFFQMEMEFADACEIPKGEVSGRVNVEAAALAFKLVLEEASELEDALDKHLANPSLENLVEVADGIGDSIYVLCQLARSLGIPLDEVYGEIHRSNMAKVGSDGTVKRRADGKILKPEGWTAPNLWEVLKRQSDSEQR